MPFQVELVSIWAVHEKAILQQLSWPTRPTSVLPTIRLEVVGIRHARMDVEVRGRHPDKLPARLRT